MSKRDEAFAFLRSFQDTLESKLPSREALVAEMDVLSKDGVSDHQIRENRFIYHFIIRQLHSHMQTVPGIGADEARRSIFCEYHAKVSDIASGNAFRRLGAPLGKQRGKSTSDIIRGWMKGKTSYPINQAYPDLAVREPFPHSIVFDIKYFESSDASVAEADLVGGVYEVMHYRGLPPVAPTSVSDPGWGYDYACLLACDVSESGALASTWKSVVAKEAFWEGANVFVMIVRE
jgi:hypothetical protein